MRKLLLAISLLAICSPVLAEERRYTLTEIDRMRQSIGNAKRVFGVECQAVSPDRNGDSWATQFDCSQGIETVLRTLMMNGTDPADVIQRCLTYQKSPNSTDPCYKSE